jgi:hypothetical protein
VIGSSENQREPSARTRTCKHFNDPITRSQIIRSPDHYN